MITEIEKKICGRMDYAQKYIDLNLKYMDDNNQTSTFIVPQVKVIFNDLEGFDYKYVGEGSHQISKKVNDLTVVYNFIISQNNAEIHIGIRKRGKGIGLKFSNIGTPLRYIPYNKSLMQKVNQSFGLNSLEDLKAYIYDLIGFCDEFVDEYIKEVESGNIVIEAES